MNRGSFLLADCLVEMKRYQADAFDLAIVDPPYGIGQDGGRQSKGNPKQKNGKRLYVRMNDYNFQSDGWDSDPPAQEYFDELFRISRHQIIWGSNNFTFDQKASSAGRIVWDKVNGTSHQSDCELAWTSLFSSIRKFDFMWNGMSQGVSVRNGRKMQGNKKLNEPRIHPTQKPVALYQWLLSLKQVQPGWRLLDTHVGSGSSLIAFDLGGFPYTGFEISPKYYVRANERIKRRLEAPLFNQI